VHHDQAAVLLRLLHRPEDRPVVGEEDARVGGEELEVGDALCHQLVHLCQGGVGDVRHDHVEAVVGAGVALRLGHPRVQPSMQRPALGLHREVDDRRRPAKRGRARSGLEGVLGKRATEGQLHVSVDVDPAGDDVLPGRIDGALNTGGEIAPSKAPTNGHDLLAVNEHLRLSRAVGVHDGAVADQDAHRSLLWPGSRNGRTAQLARRAMRPETGEEIVDQPDTDRRSGG
jgi:hypothetical protein